MVVELADDLTQHHMDESLATHRVLMTESRANSQHSGNILRTSANKKFAEIGPLEAAAAEVVLRIKPLTS